MIIDRRSAIAGLAAVLTASPLRAQDQGIGAVAFDGFALFDPAPVRAAVAEALGNDGPALATRWFARIFELSWQVTLADAYEPFSGLAARALGQILDETGQSLASGQKEHLVSRFHHLILWRDVEPALSALRARGLRLALLSNLEESMLRIASAPVAQLLDPPLSTDRVRSYKPAPRAYAMAEHAFGLPRSRIGFVAFAGWDAAGAAQYGFPTAWANRAKAPRAPWGPAPRFESPDLTSALHLAQHSTQRV